MLLQRHPEHMPEDTLVRIMELLFGEYATAWHKGHLPEAIRRAPLLRQMETTTIILPTAATMVTKATTNQHPDWQEIQTMQWNTALWLVHYLHSPYLIGDLPGELPMLQEGFCNRDRDRHMALDLMKGLRQKYIFRGCHIPETNLPPDMWFFKPEATFTFGDMCKHCHTEGFNFHTTEAILRSCVPYIEIDPGAPPDVDVD